MARFLGYISKEEAKALVAKKPTDQVESEEQLGEGFLENIQDDPDTD